jgi:hypothetical protein
MHGFSETAAEKLREKVPSDGDPGKRQQKSCVKKYHRTGIRGERVMHGFSETAAEKLREKVPSDGDPGGIRGNGSRKVA